MMNIPALIGVPLELEKMKDNVVIPTGNAGAVSSGMIGTSFSADAVGVGVSAAPVPVINKMCIRDRGRIVRVHSTEQSVGIKVGGF